MCLFWLSVDYTASTASIFNLSILSLDRYWSITSPLRYLRRRTKKRALIMIMLAWFGASMWFIPVLGWNQILRKGPSHLPGNYYININYNLPTTNLYSKNSFKKGGWQKSINFEIVVEYHVFGSVFE